MGVRMVYGGRRKTHRELRSQRTEETEKKKGNQGRDSPSQSVEEGTGCPETDKVEFW